MKGPFMKNVLILAAVLVVAGTLPAQEQRRQLSLPINGIQSLSIDCGAGFLVVRGEGNSIEVSATIRTGRYGEEAKTFIEKFVKLRLEKEGTRALLESRIDFDGRWDGTDMGIDLTITVPKNIGLDIDDGSGSMTISDIEGSLRIQDGSGSIDLRDITGDIAIRDGSGEIEVDRVKGSVFIDDGSGSMTLSHIGGNVEVTDGSGSIDIDGVEHDVRIHNAGRGGVSITHVKGKVRRDDD